MEDNNRMEFMKDLLSNIYNTVNQLEVKGYDNVDKVYGILRVIKQTLQEQEEIEKQEME